MRLYQKFYLPGLNVSTVFRQAQYDKAQCNKAYYDNK